MQAGLQKAARRKAGGYSLGMRQRLGIAAALWIGDPPALMLDEPFNGMDPEGIVWMRGFLAALAAEGRTVLVSSHLMSELQDTADHVVIIGRGKVIADMSVADLLASASGDRILLRTADLTRAAAVLTRAATTVAVDGPDALLISGLPAERVVALLTANSVPFAEVTAHRATLEEAYLELTRDAVEYRAGPARAGRAMTAPAIMSSRPTARPGRNGFAHLLRAEWTKFRTVRGWSIAVIVAVLLTVLIGLFIGSHSHVAPCTAGPAGPACHYVIPTGPGGELVTDTFYFVHRPLAGDGSITVRVTSLTEVAESSQTRRGRPVSTKPTVVPWSKAGLIITAGTGQGSGGWRARSLPARAGGRRSR